MVLPPRGTSYRNSDVVSNGGHDRCSDVGNVVARPRKPKNTPMHLFQNAQESERRAANGLGNSSGAHAESGS